jgi:putative Mg2+ transporter-C (MgtC) family protein
MPFVLGWHEIELRLGLAFLAALLIGLNRGERGEAAGLRTTLFVCMAAAVSMVQANLLLITDGKTPSSFSVLDLMRLPLGILTGMGFIGAAAVLKRGNLVLGVTTAASLWFTTVMGLCFGGGQIGLGLVCTVFALVTLWPLKWLETLVPRERRATLSVATAADGLSQEFIEDLIRQGGAEAVACAICHLPAEKVRRYQFVVRWRARWDRAEAPPFVGQLAREPALQELRWLPDSVTSNDAARANAG